jgi:carbamoyl-phosphate synthase large subunit
MKSVGEVMAIGRNIEEVLQKAIRNLDIGMHGVVGNLDELNFKESDLDHATPKRIFAIARAFIKGKSIEHVHKKTLIDRFFLEKVHNIVKTRADLLSKQNGKLIVADKDIISKAKKQ